MASRLTSLACHRHTLTFAAVIAAAMCAFLLHDRSPKTQVEVQGLIMLVAAPLIGHAHRRHEIADRHARYQTHQNIIPLKRASQRTRR